MAVITIQGLTKRFGPVTAVDDLSFEVDQGTVVGFLGPNGAGKTTTLRMLLGLVTPTAGSARIHLRVVAAAAGLPYARADAVLEQVGLAQAARRRVGGFSLGMRQRLG